MIFFTLTENRLLCFTIQMLNCSEPEMDIQCQDQKPYIQWVYRVKGGCIAYRVGLYGIRQVSMIYGGCIGYRVGVQYNVHICNSFQEYMGVCRTGLPATQTRQLHSYQDISSFSTWESSSIVVAEYCMYKWWECYLAPQAKV